MQYEEIRCRVCGSERLEKQNDGTYVCGHCRSRFRENDLEEYKKTIRSELRGVVTEALVCQRAQDVANIRRNLFEALQEEYTDSYKIIGYCRDLKRLLPNDFQANCFETLNNGRKKEVNAMLGSVDEKGAGRFYVKDILEFMVKSLTPANLLPLKSLAERALKDEEKTEYLNKIEEEAGKCEAGLYSPEVPRKAFIAYSSKDMAIVTPLVEYLENAGISCFVALRNMRHGRKAVEKYDKILQRAMHNCKSFVLISTRNSRRFDCDAIEKELPYVRDNEPNVKRIEYLVEDYGESEGAIKSMLKDFFGGSGWVRNLEDLPSRIMDIKPQAVKYCLTCGAENPMNINFCGQCGKRDFGTKEEYEKRKQELERLEDEQKKAAAPAVKYCLTCGAENPVNVNFCGQCGKREFGTKDEYEERQKELERLETEQKEAERKEAERKEAECREASQKKVEKTKEATAASKAEAKAIPAASSDPADFEIEDGILKKYRDNGGDVIIPNGVTSIGEYAFAYCSGLTSITIPSSVTSIGEGAFYGCSGLTSITIPNSVTSIGESAFEDCNGLKSIDIPNGVTSIGENAFSGCSGLTRITIPSSVTSIGEYAFAYCSGLTSITIPSSVTSIGESAFEDCNGLKSIDIPNGVTSIGEGAFYGCSGLTSITIPNSVTSIGENAFSGCSGLTRITIPSSVTSIDGNVFDCEDLEEIKVEKGNPVYHSDGSCLIKTKSGELIAGCKNSRIPTDGSVTSIGKYAFCDCSGLTRITIPKSVTSIGEGAFYGCSGLTSITIPNSVTSIDKDFVFGKCESLVEIKVEKGNPVYHSAGNCLIETRSRTLVAGCKNSKIPSDGSVTSIGEGAFAFCHSLIETIIPNNITDIDAEAFRECSSLTSITIPNSITCIGDWAFTDCSSLTSITIPNSVTSIEEGAFCGCSSLTSITIPDSVTSIKIYIFAYCESLEEIKVENENPVYHSAWNCLIETKNRTLVAGCKNSRIPTDGSVTSIGWSAFEGCSNLTSITIPNSVTSIGWSAFKGCSNLTSITIPNSVTSIGGYAFSGCSGLTSITIPSSVTSIGSHAFYGCSSLKSITIPSSVTSIGSHAFYGCSGLTSITIPDSVMSIEEGAFKGCSGLTSITIPKSVTSIGVGAFYGCSKDLKIYCHDRKPLKWPEGWDVLLKDRIIWEE